MAVEKTCRRTAFKPLPSAVARLLQDLQGFEGHGLHVREHIKLAAKLEGTELFTVILFAEPLAREHWRYKKYVNMRRERICSELEEMIHREFCEELNKKMADHLRHHRDPNNEYLDELVKSYYPQAKRILRARYREFHPLSWQRKWWSRAYLKPRTRVEKRRRWDIPEPFCWWDTLLPQQFYFMKESHAYARGCGSGSGSREAHSYFGLAFLELARHVTIPSYILVYDKDNVLRFVDGLDTFCLMPRDMGMNCDVDYKTVSRLMASFPKVEATRSEDWSEISEVRVFV